MKKLLMCLMMLAFFGSMQFSAMAVSASAENSLSELFYCEYTQEVASIIESIDYQSERYARRYVEEHYLSEGEEYDATKVSYRPEEMVAVRLPTPKQYIELLKSDDFSETLGLIEVDSWIYPVYYDGELLTEYMDGYALYTKDDGSTYYRNAGKGNKLEERYTIAFNKERLLKYWETQNIVGYQPVQTLLVKGFYMTVAEKDGELYSILNDFDSAGSDHNRTTMQEIHPELMAKKVWTVAETEQAFSDLSEALKQKVETGEIQTNIATMGTIDVQKSETDLPSSNKTATTVVYVVIGAAVLIAAVAVLLMLKKRK